MLIKIATKIFMNPRLIILFFFIFTINFVSAENEEGFPVFNIIKITPPGVIQEAFPESIENRKLSENINTYIHKYNRKNLPAYNIDVEIGLSRTREGFLIQTQLTDNRRLITGKLTISRQEIFRYVEILGCELFYQWYINFSTPDLWPEEEPPRPGPAVHINLLQEMLNLPADLPVDIHYYNRKLWLLFPGLSFPLTGRGELTDTSFSLPLFFDGGSYLAVFRGQKDELILFSPQNVEFRENGVRTGRQLSFSPFLSMVVSPGEGVFFATDHTKLYQIDHKGMNALSLPGEAAYIPLLAANSRGESAVFASPSQRLYLLDKRGNCLAALKPLVPRGRMAAPQFCALFDDRSFILGDNRALTCFDPEGIPLWEINHLEFPRKEALPPSLKILPLEGRDFLILDKVQGRLIPFTAPSPEAATPGENSIKEVKKLTEERQFLKAGQQAASFSSPDLPLEEKIILNEARKGFHKEHIAALLREGDRMYRSLLIPESHKLYQAALATATRNREEDPVDPDYPALLEEALKKSKQTGDLLYSLPPVSLSLELCHPPSTSFIRVRINGGRLPETARLRGFVYPPGKEYNGEFTEGELLLPLSFSEKIERMDFLLTGTDDGQPFSWFFQGLPGGGIR